MAELNELGEDRLEQLLTSQQQQQQQQHAAQRKEVPFFCCYLLTGAEKTTSKRTYIGFTVDPRKRLRQHNGEVKGGARRTARCKGDWKMVLFVFGFPSKIAALRFEWAWQHPTLSRRLRDCNLGRSGPDSNKSASTDRDGGGETKQQRKRGRRPGPQLLNGALSTLQCMLNTQPWSSLALHVCWVDCAVRDAWQTQLIHPRFASIPSAVPDHMAEFTLPGGLATASKVSLDDLFLYVGQRERRHVSTLPSPSPACSVCTRPLSTRGTATACPRRADGRNQRLEREFDNADDADDTDDDADDDADEGGNGHGADGNCGGTAAERVLRCLSPTCGMQAHATCLSTCRHRRGEEWQSQMESLVPAFVVCPVCDTRLCWGDVVLNARRRAANGSQIVFAQVSFVYSVYLVVCVCVSVCGCLCLGVCVWVSVSVSVSVPVFVAVAVMNRARCMARLTTVLVLALCFDSRAGELDQRCACIPDGGHIFAVDVRGHACSTQLLTSLCSACHMSVPVCLCMAVVVVVVVEKHR